MSLRYVDVFHIHSLLSLKRFFVSAAHAKLGERIPKTPTVAHAASAVHYCNGCAVAENVFRLCAAYFNWPDWCSFCYAFWWCASTKTRARARIRVRRVVTALVTCSAVDREARLGVRLIKARHFTASAVHGKRLDIAPSFKKPLRPYVGSTVQRL